MRQIPVLTRESEIKQWAVETIQTELEAIQQLEDRLEGDLPKVVQLILNSKGRVVITGIGKSAAIANKIVATLNSTGTPSIFMHAADAVHGDLGIIQQDDVVICLSKSGNTPEIKVLVPLLKASGNRLVAMVGNKDSFLGQHADHILDVSVEKEACPHDLAPTTSTTVQLVMGDALAVCLLNARGFTSADFARYHPGGSLGKRLYMRLSDLIDPERIPAVTSDQSIKDVIVEITEKRLGATAVVENEQLVGIITDGDIRRMLESQDHIGGLVAGDIMTKDPIRLEEDVLAREAAETMIEKKITQMLVTKNDKYVGMCHLHDFHNEGII